MIITRIKRPKYCNQYCCYVKVIFNNNQLTIQNNKCYHIEKKCFDYPQMILSIIATSIFIITGITFVIILCMNPTTKITPYHSLIFDTQYKTIFTPISPCVDDKIIFNCNNISTMTMDPFSGVCTLTNITNNSFYFYNSSYTIKNIYRYQIDGGIIIDIDIQIWTIYDNFTLQIDNLNNSFSVIKQQTYYCPNKSIQNFKTCNINDQLNSSRLDTIIMCAFLIITMLILIFYLYANPRPHHTRDDQVNLKISLFHRNELVQQFKFESRLPKVIVHIIFDYAVDDMLKNFILELINKYIAKDFNFENYNFVSIVNNNKENINFQLLPTFNVNFNTDENHVNIVSCF